MRSPNEAASPDPTPIGTTPAGSYRRGIIYALATAVVSGFAVFVNGVAVRRFDDATVYTTAKNLVAGSVLLLAATWLVQARRSPPPIARRSWPLLGVIAVVGGSVPFVLFFEGLGRATSTNAAFIHKTLVLWVAIGATIVLRERITLVHAGAIALLLAGHLWLTGGLGAASFGSAEGLVLVATLLWSTEVIVLKRLLGTVPAATAAASRMAGGSVLLIVWVGVQGDLGALAGLGGRQWAWVVLTGTMLSVFVSLWYRALALAPAVDVTAVLVLGAVITGLLNSGFRGVPLTVDSYGYVLLALGAIVVAARGLRRPVPA
jgi:drug/metabolite transporter (DMT)-like permease